MVASSSGALVGGAVAFTNNLKLAEGALYSTCQYRALPHGLAILWGSNREFNLTSSASADIDLMRASMLLDTNPAAAAASASVILKSHPQHEGASLLLAAARRRLGDSAGSDDRH